MKKRILILVYIAMVLALSGLAKADITIDSLRHGVGTVLAADLNQRSAILTVQGILNNPCQEKPNLVVTKVDNAKNIINLRVVTNLTATNCVQILGKQFDIEYDLTDLRLSANKTYALEFEGYAGEGFLNIKYQTREFEFGVVPSTTDKFNFRGKLVLTNKGFALNIGRTFVPVVAPRFTLERFQDNAVGLSGYQTSVDGQVAITPVSVSTTRE